MRLVIVILLLIHFASYADQKPPVMDGASREALAETQKAMRDEKARRHILNANPEAQSADAKVEALTGDKRGKEEVYDLSAELVAKIAEEAGGDPIRMRAIAEEAQKNPQAFYDRMMTPEQKARVKSIADKADRKALEPAKP